jgi:CubicO group peptidase (beta-lactamase class C family)
MGASALEGSPGSDVWSTAEDLARFAAEVLNPTLLHDATVEEMCTVQFPGLSGVLPGHGRYDPLDWGLGFEMNFGRPGHWGGQLLSGRTAGHFGAGGTFLWVDRPRGLAAAALTDREFEQWARDAWPELNDAIVRESGADGDASST